MAVEDITELKAEAKRLGVTWAEVVSVKKECQEVMLAARETEEGVRREAWRLFLHYSGRSVAGCQAFWRVGWDHLRARLENKGFDHTSIPGYDLIATGVAEEFPEWEGRDSGDLFAFLFVDYERRPSAFELYSEALGRIEAHVAQSTPAPF